MAVNSFAWEASQILRMHATRREVATIPDPHARWRDLVNRDNPTATYRRGRCAQCRDDGACELLDAAQDFAATVFPFLSAEEISGDHPLTRHDVDPQWTTAADGSPFT